MKKFTKNLLNNPGVKKFFGITIVLLGLLALVTPLTPGSWLIFLGLSYLGFNFLFWDKIKNYLKIIINKK
ncbi:MAG: PGPGW domain-containing protein [Patescibacteria group bacterium]